MSHKGRNHTQKPTGCKSTQQQLATWTERVLLKISITNIRCRTSDTTRNPESCANRRRNGVALYRHTRVFWLWWWRGCSGEYRTEKKPVLGTNFGQSHRKTLELNKKKSAHARGSDHVSTPEWRVSLVVDLKLKSSKLDVLFPNRNQGYHVAFKLEKNNDTCSKCDELSSTTIADRPVLLLIT